MIGILFSSALCVTTAFIPRRKTNSQQGEEGQSPIRSQAYTQTPFTSQPLYYEYPRMHVVHPDDHFSSVFDALLGVNEESPFDSLLASQRGSHREISARSTNIQPPVHSSIVLQESGPVKNTVRPAPNENDGPLTLNTNTAFQDQTVDEDPSPRDMRQRKNPSRSVFTQLLSATIKFFLFSVCVCFLLSFLYSVYKRNTYTQIDEYGNPLGGEGWHGVMFEFRNTLRRVILYVWRLNPLRGQPEKPFTGSPAPQSSMMYDRTERGRHNDPFGVN